MLRPTMMFWCLIAALAGTPLRQAEAASNLARSLSELEDGGTTLEEVDGGVGDDAELGTLTLDCGFRPAQAMSPWGAMDTITPHGAALRANTSELARHRSDQIAVADACPAKRYVWPQVLLF